MKIVKVLTKFLIVLIFTFLAFTTKVKANDIIPMNKWNIYLTFEEIEVLSRIVQLEAGGEIKESKYATIETILNRIVSEKYPNTLLEVVSQNGQFSTWKNVMSIKATPSIDTYQSVVAVLTGQTNILTFNNLKFNNKPIGNNPIKIGNQYYGE